jgi:hypothetical protein
VSEPSLLQFPRSPVLHIDGGFGSALCGRSGVDAMARGLLRDHTPFDKPICRRCQKQHNPCFEDLAREGGI